MQKQIKTLIGIIIIVVAAIVILFGSVFVWLRQISRSETYQSQTPTTNIQPNPKSQTVSQNISEIKNKIIGTWQGNPDTKAKLIFSQDGTYKDSYEGISTSSEEGKWDIVASLKGTSYEQFQTENTVYLKKMDNNGQVRDYLTIEVGDNILGLTVLGRGTTAGYTRAK